MCEHIQSELIRIKEIDYNCEDEVSFLIEDRCIECSEVLGQEIHTFKFSYSEGVD